MPDIEIANPDVRNAIEVLEAHGAQVGVEWGVRYGSSSSAVPVLNEALARSHRSIHGSSTGISRRLVVYGPWEQVPEAEERCDDA